MSGRPLQPGPFDGWGTDPASRPEGLLSCQFAMRSLGHFVSKQLHNYRAFLDDESKESLIVWLVNGLCYSLSKIKGHYMRVSPFIFNA